MRIRNWTVIMILILILGFVIVDTAEAQDAVTPTDLEVQVLSKGEIRITAEPLGTIPTVSEMEATLQEAGWDVVKVTRPRLSAVRLHLAEPVDTAASTYTLNLSIEDIQRALDLDHPVGEVRLILPNSLAPEWLSSDHVTVNYDKASYTTYILVPETEGIFVRVGERPDLGRIFLQTMLWVLLPTAIGWIGPYWLLRRNPTIDVSSGKLPQSFNILNAVTILASAPWQNMALRWFVAWPEWHFGYSPFMILFAIAFLCGLSLLASIPYLRLYARARRGLPPWERRMTGRMTVAQLLPVFILMLLNLLLLFNPFVDYNKIGRWGILIVQPALLLISLFLTPPLFRWVFRPRPLEGPLGEEIASLVARAGVRVKGLYLIPGRATSPFLNAVTVGILPQQRMILLTEDLVSEFDPAAVRAVAAHEIGHQALHHIPKQALATVLFAALVALVLPFIPQWILRNSVFAPMLIGSCLYLVFTVVSRRHEYQADRFAAELVGAESMVAALDHLQKAYPDKVRWSRFLWWTQTHPTLPDRIKRVAAP